ncbi:hypothetical protein CYY_008262 [Polysphondylium violaceum]|uniref:MD-2-related lipid-recognition domain-containing protein n=1 Tax=Polysphondylium violaceum TaxID=133409 RepID=A0A8J4PNI9_9MYCE|nr:hypothetical protein CYY_008262 [Polysphondylium violaceum]
MKQTLFIIFAISVILATVAHADIWSQCPGNSDPTFSITTLTVTPDPPKIGQSCVVNLVGTLNDEVTSGSSLFTLYFYIAGGWRKLPSFSNDVCKIVTCPVQPGPFKFTTTINVPFITPPGQYQGSLILTDQNSRNITCLDFATTLSH